MANKRIINKTLKRILEINNKADDRGFITDTEKRSLRVHTQRIIRNQVRLIRINKNKFGYCGDPQKYGAKFLELMELGRRVFRERRSVCQSNQND